LEHHLKFPRLSQEISQSRAFQELTVLATIFLPLSLAAGVLSMHFRFKDLGARFYDFLGVFVLLVTFAAVLVGIISALVFVQELESTWTRRFYKR
jgi:Mg2+ and Co2+ transporter CorA